MPVIFADPFGSFFDGFERGQDQRLEVESFNVELFDRFVFSPQQQIAKEQRAFARSIDLMERRRAAAKADRETRAAAAAVDKKQSGVQIFTRTGAPLGFSSTPAPATSGNTKLLGGALNGG